MIQVSIQVSSRYPVNRRRVRQVIKKTLRGQGISDAAQVGVEVVGDRKMEDLNRKFMGKIGTTDVLSFPLAETSRVVSEVEREFVEIPVQRLRLGDIVISYPQARKQAQDHNLLVDEEIDRLVEHGVKHLLGMHHD